MQAEKADARNFEQRDDFFQRARSHKIARLPRIPLPNHTDATFTHGICPDCLVKFKAGVEMPTANQAAIRVSDDAPALPTIEIRTLEDS